MVKTKSRRSVKKHKKSMKMRRQFGGDKDIISNFKAYVAENRIDHSQAFIERNTLNKAFSYDVPQIKAMLDFLRKQVVETATVGEIVNDVYKLTPIPVVEADMDFPAVPTEVKTFTDLFNIKPNDCVVWKNFLIKFYDFNIPSHKKYRQRFVNPKTAGELRTTTCGSDVSPQYILESFEKCDHLIVVSDYRIYADGNQDNSEYSDIYAFSMNNTLNYNKTGILETYTSTTCSSTLTTLEDEKLISFGLMLRYILLNHLKSEGYSHAYNDAATNKLIPYYSRWNYRLGKEKCTDADELTQRHNTLISQKDEAYINAFYKEIDAMDYHTNSGYRMKLCNIDLTGWKEYLIRTNTGIDERLSVNEDAYDLYREYKTKKLFAIKANKAIAVLKMINEDVFEFEGLTLKEAINTLEFLPSNEQAYAAVIKVIKRGLITLNDISDGVLGKMKSIVWPGGPYLPSMKSLTIRKIKEKESID
jgi:hypothetical protein